MSDVTALTATTRDTQHVAENSQIQLWRSMPALPEYAPLPHPSVVRAPWTDVSTNDVNGNSQDVVTKALPTSAAPVDVIVSLLLSDTYGSLEHVGQGTISGWAYDPNYAGAVRVEIYVDGALMQIATANQYRPDLVGACPKVTGNCGFIWNYQPNDGFGPGPFNGNSFQHQFSASAIRVDVQGAPTGEKVSLLGSGIYFRDEHCTYLGNTDAYSWCSSNGGYWSPRETDTTLLGNSNIRLGVNNSYGGTIMQLRARAQTGNVAWGTNLIGENGGSAMQLSIWGGDANSSNTQHPALCDSGKPIIWNPIQAQGAYCQYTDTTNDVSAKCFVADDSSTTCLSANSATFYTKQDSPGNFTFNVRGVGGLHFEQWVTMFNGFAKVRYKVTADATFNSNNETTPATWDARPQEIPALFTNEGINAAFYSYTGSSPFTGDALVPSRDVLGAPDATKNGRFLRLPPNPPLTAFSYPHPNPAPPTPPTYELPGCATEGWWGVCDASGTKCVTIATFDNAVKEGSIMDTPGPPGAPLGPEGYISPIGYFNLQANSSVSWSIYVFPYRYDQVPDGNTRTTRAIIKDLAVAAGVPMTNRVCTEAHSP